jgi:small subunit ribosomal protein S16
VGFYNPLAKDGEEGLRLVQDRLAYWQGVGAQLSPTVARLVKQGAAKAAA